MVITSATDAEDIAQILYGLSIRGVRAHAVANSEKRLTTEAIAGNPDRWLIVLESPSDIKHMIATDSIGPIWDAILEGFERAVTQEGHCVFCGYDVNRLPRPTTCPECGANLDLISTRRAMRARSL